MFWDIHLLRINKNIYYLEYFRLFTVNDFAVDFKYINNSKDLKNDFFFPIP